MNQIVNVFQAFRQILCICPCCGEMNRLSNIHLKYKGVTKRLWLDEYEKKSLLLQKREEKFDEVEGKLREKARERGRKKAQEIFDKAIAPEYKKLKLDPYDIKPILHPVDFLVFKGMNSGRTIEHIEFLSRACKGKEINCARDSLRDSILKKKYEWKVARVGETGTISFE